MTTTVVKASKELRTATSTVRKVFDAHDRAREIYLQQMRRAEADYCERIKQAMTLITGDEGIQNNETMPADQPAAS
jgi:hypothetical protein